MNKKLSKEEALQELISLGIIKEEADLRKNGIFSCKISLILIY